MRQSVEVLRPALYYPYIHIRSEHWLKATLLCVPSVKRIVPTEYVPEDRSNILKYTQLKGPHGFLLQAVRSDSTASRAAQRRLTQKVEQHIDTIKALYQRSTAPGPDRYWIHDQKLSYALRNHLQQHELAWDSHDPHGHGDRQWLALHPTLGSALMTTIGLSIAKAERLDVVTPSRRFHETLLATEEEDVFERLLTGKRARRVPLQQARHDLGELVIALGTNLQALPAEAIPDLQQSDRFIAFQKLIRQTAAVVNREGDSRDYRRELEQEAHDLIDAWRDSKRTFSRGVRQSVFEQGARTAVLAKVAATGHAVAAGAGLSIFLVAQKVRQLRKTHGGDPLHYLTQVRAATDKGMLLRFPLGLER